MSLCADTMDLSARFWRDLILLMYNLLAFPQTTRPYERCELKMLKYNDLNTDNGHKSLIL